VVSGFSRPADLTVTRVGDLHVGFRLDAVQEVLMGTSITPVPLAESGYVGLINVRGEILSVVDLAVVLGRPRPPDAEHRPVHVVVRTTRGLVSVVVDQVNDVVHAPADAYGDVQGRATEHFTGAYALVGRLVLVLDIERAVWGDREHVTA
jgi:purine-binding chemotaxis protein CheW